MEQPPAPCTEAQEALSPPGAGAGVDTFTNASKPETPPKDISRLPRKKKKQKKTKKKGELVLWMKGGTVTGDSPPPPPSLAWPASFLLGKSLVKCNRASCSGPHDNWG